MSANPFVWYELATSDVDAALGFYGALLGWTAQDFPGNTETRYVIVTANGKGVGGVMTLPAGMSEPFWLGYVGTNDIDAATASFTGAGGTLHRGPWEIPQVGRLALVSDPQGAGLAMIQGASDQPSEAFNQSLPGHGNWNELHTTDPDAAMRFYSAQFGWTAGRAMPMGPNGTYQLFQADGTDIGGISPMLMSSRPSWLYYFGVADVTAAIARIGDNGGAVLMGPQEVPGGAVIVIARDPQGASFAVVGPGSGST